MIERRLTVSPLEPQSSNFPQARQAILAKRTVTNKKTGQEVTGGRYFISSISPGEASPRQMARLVRGHWTVENNIHWLRDAVGREDTCRLRNPNAACALALLRTALLAPVRAAGHQSLTQFQETCAKNQQNALQIIAFQRLA